MPRDGNKPPRRPQQRAVSERVVGIIINNNGHLELHDVSRKGPLSANNSTVIDFADAKEGDIVVAKRKEPQNPLSDVSITRILGTRETPGILGLVSFYEQGGLSATFNEAVLRETPNLAVPDLGDREDLRNVPLVTVDGADSRDFDDAIYAEKKPDGGYHLIVAIADVSYYVRPGSELDKEAYSRGNSYYFPDGVVPMLPEALSNGICSLKPHEDRAVMVYHLDIDKDGNLTDYKINRGLMKSAARITYEELQAAKDGKPSEQLKPLMETVVNPLYGAYSILKKASLARGKIDMHGLDNADTSHYVIEEFMILANIAGDKALEQSIHRYHAPPPEKKLEELGRFLAERGLALPEDVSDPRAFGPLLEQAKQRPDASAITNAIARAQSKAVYDPLNDGHYGLALEGYGHHTSPIRRYSDLVNHRLLTEAFNLGAGAITPGEKAKLAETAEHITNTEIIATKAERAADDRFAAKALEDHVGETFKGKIRGMVEGGLFVKIDGMSAEGYLRLNTLPDDNYTVDKVAGLCKGENHSYSKGDELEVTVVKADSLTGDVLLSAGGSGANQAAREQDKENHAANKQETAKALQSHVGQNYEGTITGINRAGIFVRIDGMKADGLILYRDLPEDFYQASPDGKSCTGRKTGNSYAVGDRLHVSVAEVDVAKSNVYLATNDNASSGAPKAPQQKQHNNNGKTRGPKHHR